jgi:CIC family chloride channel protein
MFELTGDYAIILPLMAAIVLAAGMSHLLSTDTIYTLKLRRRGIDLDKVPTHPMLASTTVGQLMEPNGQPAIPADIELAAAAARLARAPHGQLPVTDSTGCYLGVATTRAVTEALAAAEDQPGSISSILEYPPTVTADQSLEHSLDALGLSATPVPVLDPAKAHLVGWLAHRQVLQALQATAANDAARSSRWPRSVAVSPAVFMTRLRLPGPGRRG